MCILSTLNCFVFASLTWFSLCLNKVNIAFVPLITICWRPMCAYYSVFCWFQRRNVCWMCLDGLSIHAQSQSYHSTQTARQHWWYFVFEKKCVPYRVLYMKSLSDALRDKSIIPIEFRFSKAHKNFFLHFRSSAILLSLCSRSIYSPKWNGCSPKCFFIFYRCAFSGFYRHKERLSKYIIFLFLCDTNNYSIKKKIFGCLECYHILLLCSCCSMACSSDQIFW